MSFCFRLVGILLLLVCNCLSERRSVSPSPSHSPSHSPSSTPTTAPTALPATKTLGFHVTVSVDSTLDAGATTTCTTGEVNHFGSKLSDYVLQCAQNILGYNNLTLNATTWSSARRRRTSVVSENDKKMTHDKQQERSLQFIDPRIYFDGSYGCNFCMPDDEDDRRRRSLGMLMRHHSLEAVIRLVGDEEKQEEEKKSRKLLLRGGGTETPSSSSSSRSFSRHNDAAGQGQEERRVLTTSNSTRIALNVSDQVFEQDMSNDLSVSMQSEAAAWLLSNVFIRDSCLGNGAGVVVTFSIV